MTDKKYFHEITEADWEKIKADKWTWDEVAKEYLQPDWCGYPQAVHGLGCWSLIGIGKPYRITKEDDCKKCDLYRGEKC
ncbi:MAG: hypothetical protein V1690_03810 [Candidatus Moraniibacteriota bacterium]